MSILKSKKFLVAIAGVLAEAVMHYFNVPTETTMSIAGIIIAYIVGQGLSDLGKGAK